MKGEEGGREKRRKEGWWVGGRTGQPVSGLVTR